ncbi:MAG: COX15/CtaA family protein [Hyphomicrobiales bacterium]|nr:COX15/CtaA family protein [Hyphomicrobiales bacterium]
MTLSTVEPRAFGLAASAKAERAVPAWIPFWLWATAALVILMVAVGGVTRLTGSGLSITQWRPISGALPPLSHTDWLAEFARYRESSQAKLVNTGMSLEEFKQIFWWEWGHRQLGRFIGLFFAAGFLFGLAARQFSWRLGLTLAGMGLLLGVQGGIGWIMVASGLKSGMTAVEPLDLAAHLLFASLFLVTVVALATALGEDGRIRPGVPAPAARLSKLILGVILLQLVLGALVAGSHAGLVYNTWPDMDGRFVPPLRELLAVAPWWANPFENLTLIQFDHRMLAYGVLVLALGNAIIWWRAAEHPSLSAAGASRQSAPTRLALLLAGLVMAQVALGIATLLHAVPLGLALAHQLLAMFVLVAATRLAVLSRERAVAAPAVSGPLAAHVATR